MTERAAAVGVGRNVCDLVRARMVTLAPAMSMYTSASMCIVCVRARALTCYASTHRVMEASVGYKREGAFPVKYNRRHHHVPPPRRAASLQGGPPVPVRAGHRKFPPQSSPRLRPCVAWQGSRTGHPGILP